MNILILSHFFEPYSQVGGKRMTSLAFYFAQLGHKVFVVKARDEEYGDKLLKNTLVHENMEILSISHTYKNRIVQKMLRVPEYWRTSRQILNSHKINCLIISAGPFNYFAVAKKVKSKYPNIKCILDFRDLLDNTQCQANKVTFLQNIGFLMDIHMEKKAVAIADLCLTVTDTMNTYYQRRYPLYQSKFRVVMNGYDDVSLSKKTIHQIREFKGYERANKRQLSVGIFGKFGFYDLNYAEMLAGVIEKYADCGYDIQIIQLGLQENSLKSAMQKGGVGEHYHYIPSEGYENDIVKLQKCDVTMTSNYMREAMGTKIFDYIFVGRPIVTIIPFHDSELGNLTQKFKNGFVCTNQRELYAAFGDLLKLNPCFLDTDQEKAKEYGRMKQFNRLNYYIIEMLERTDKI